MPSHRYHLLNTYVCVGFKDVSMMLIDASPPLTFTVLPRMHHHSHLHTLATSLLVTLLATRPTPHFYALTSSTNVCHLVFAAARRLTQTAAADLHGADSVEQNAVAAAWSAVNVV